MSCSRQVNSLISTYSSNPNCPVGAPYSDVLDQKVERIQLAMEAELGQTSLEQVVADAEGQMKD